MLKSTFILIATLIVLFTAMGLFANSDFFYGTTTSVVSKDFHKQVRQVSYNKENIKSDILIILN